MTPEVQILLINAMGLALAYGVIYPRLAPITVGKIAIADAVLTALLLGVAGYVFWGMGAQFWLLGWYVGPVLFSLITLACLEFPLFSWFMAKHNLKF
jgi:hypothetical protein